MGNTKNSGKGGTIIAVVAIIAFVVLGLAWLSQPTEVRTTELEKAETTDTGDGATPAATPATPASTWHSGTLTITPTDGAGGTAATSSMLFLSQTYAVFDANNVYDEQATRYKIQKAIADNSQSVTNLKPFNGDSPKINSASSGSYSETLDGKINDQLIAYTYEDHTPGIQENISTAKLLTLIGFDDSNQKWTAQQSDGSSAKYKIYNYANWNWTSDAGTTIYNYTIGDSGTTSQNKEAPFQMNATDIGELCPNCGIFIVAPKNYTAKFIDLTLNARTVKSGAGSVKFTSLQSPAAAGVSIAGSLSALTSAVPDFNHDLFFLGKIPKNFDTERKSNSDRNAITATLRTDTYGTNVNLTLYVVENVDALGTTNGAFTITAPFVVHLSKGSTSGSNIGEG